MMNVLKEILTGEKPEEKKVEKKEEKSSTTVSASTSTSGSTQKFEEKAKTEKYEAQVFKSTGPVTEEVTQKTKIVQETIVPTKKEVIQPVIVREREQVEINQVVQPYEVTEIRPAVVKERELPSEYREYRQGMSEETKREYKEESSKFQSTVEYAPVEYQRIERPPVIHETVHKVVKTEVQPVIYKQTIQPEIIKETKPIYEKIVEAPIVHKETKEVKKLETIRAEGQTSAETGQGLEKKMEKVSISSSTTTQQTSKQS
jgi:hypothetical protein